MDFTERLGLYGCVVGIFAPVVYLGLKIATLRSSASIRNNIPGDPKPPRKTLSRARLLLGLLCAGGGSYITFLAHKGLGKNWSMTLETRQGHQLIIKGVYNTVRHPMYSGLTLYGIGVGLMCPNKLAGWIYLAVWLPLMVSRIPKEEQMMKDEFDAKYVRYMRNTPWKVIPYVY